MFRVVAAVSMGGIPSRSRDRSCQCVREIARKARVARNITRLFTHLMRPRRSRSARLRARERARGPPRRVRTSARDEPPAVMDVRGVAVRTGAPREDGRTRRLPAFGG